MEQKLKFNPLGSTNFGKQHVRQRKSLQCTRNGKRIRHGLESRLHTCIAAVLDGNLFSIGTVHMTPRVFDFLQRFALISALLTIAVIVVGMGVTLFAPLV